MSLILRTLKEMIEERPQQTAISTKLPLLDAYLRGGIPFGSVTEVRSLSMKFVTFLDCWSCWCWKSKKYNYQK